MPIRDLQARLTEVGRIRLGIQVPTRNNKLRPEKLDTFRFTSRLQHLIEEIAGLYGGEPKPWGDKQFEVITQTSIVPVYVPTAQNIDPWYEAWGKNYCKRRCDGVRDTIQDEPCVCQNLREDDPSRCKPVVRVSLMLADVPGLGVWRLESHGINAAAELSRLGISLAAAPVPLLPGRLVLESRPRSYWDNEEKKVKSQDIYVPAIHIDGVTMRQLQSGAEAVANALGQGVPQQVGSADRPAIESGPTGQEMVRADLRTLLEQATTRDEMLAVREKAVEFGEDTKEFVQAWTAKAREMAAALARQEDQRDAPDQPAQTAPPAPPAAPPAAQERPPARKAAPAPARAPEPTGDGPEPDREDVGMQLLAAAGRKGLDSIQLDAMARDVHGVPVADLNGWQLQDLLAQVKQ